MEAVFKPMHVRVTEQGDPYQAIMARDECKGHFPNCTDDHNLDAFKKHMQFLWDGTANVRLSKTLPTRLTRGA